MHRRTAYPSVINEIHPGIGYDETSVTEEEKLLMEKIIDFSRQQRERLPPLQGVDSEKLKEVVSKVNAVLGKGAGIRYNSCE